MPAERKPPGSADSAGRRRLRSQNWLFTLAFVGLASGTVTGAVLARRSALDRADRQTEEVTALAASSLENEVRGSTSSLGGASTILDADGLLDPGVFDTFAQDVLAGGRVPGLLLLGVVPDEERAAFEDAVGRPITVDDDGESVPAGPSPVYFPVVAEASDQVERSDIGDDLGADPVRGAALRAAVRTGRPIVTGVSTSRRRAI